VDIWNVGAALYSGCGVVIAEKSGPVWVGMDWHLFAIGPTAGLGPRELPVEHQLPVGKLDSLLASQRGGYWRLADGHVQKCRTNRVERDFGLYPWGRTPITAACEDQQGNLLVGTRGSGVFWFDSEGKASCLSTNEGLSDNYILSLHVDREGSLWVGTDGCGLNRVKRQAFNTVEESRGSVARSVCEDGQG